MRTAHIKARATSTRLRDGGMSRSRLVQGTEFLVPEMERCVPRGLTACSGEVNRWPHGTVMAMSETGSGKWLLE
jgi:hypothetical protein